MSRDKTRVTNDDEFAEVVVVRQHRKRVRLVGGNSISGGTCCRTELLGRVNDDDTCRATDLSMKDTTKVMSTTALITQTTL